MAKKSSVSMDIEKMKKLYKGLQTKAVIQVGVFQSKSARRDGGLTNADLASYHEYGAPEHGLPARSMLRTPIFDHVNEIMSPFKGKAEAFLANGTIEQLYKLIGIACEKVVLGAFKTGGYGKWPHLKNAAIWRKLKGSIAKKANKFWNIKAGNIGEGILIDTTQLEHSFSSRVRMTL